MNAFINFFKNRISELHNITWPTRRQAIHSMGVVLVIMLVTGIFLGFLDSIFSQLVNLITK